MPKRARTRTALELRRLTKPGIYAVGDVTGLHLRIKSEGSKAWTLRVLFGGRRRDIGLGSYPSVTLEDARAKAREARRLIDNGEDPVLVRRQRRVALLAEHGKAVTFDEAVKIVLAWKQREFRNVKHAAQWEATLQTYANPVVGPLPVHAIETGHILKILEPLWMTKTETASRVRQRLETVIDWAIAADHAPGPNPARWKGHLDKLLPKVSKVRRVTHHRALPYRDVPAFMTRLRAQHGLAARALAFTILTAARSGEVRGATWGEIDRDARIWTVPADRMKAYRDHRVPLAPEALQLLDAAPRIQGSALIFPAPRGGRLSDVTLLAVLRRMNVDAVPHGFRSSFKTWASETTAFPRDVVEAALAHVLTNKTEAAYERGDLLEKRRALMEAWAAYVSRTQNKKD